MKRLITAALALILAVTGAAAQSPQRATELSVSYGAFPATNYMATYRNHYDLSNAWGTVNVELARRLADRWIIGLSYGFSSSPGLRGADHLDRDVDATWHNMMANFRFTYLYTNGWVFYGHAAVGITLGYFSPSWEESYNNTRFAWQCSPIGIEYDFNRYFGLYFEAGMGNQGIVQLGFRLGL